MTDPMSDLTGSESLTHSFTTVVDSLMVVGHMGLIVMVAQHMKSDTDQDTRIGYAIRVSTNPSTAYPGTLVTDECKALQLHHHHG